MTPGMYLTHVLLSGVAGMCSALASYQCGIRGRHLTALYFATLGGVFLAYLVELNFGKVL